MRGNVAKTREARVARGSLLTCITEASISHLNEVKVPKTIEARVAQGSLLTCITEPMQFGAERK